MVAQTEIRTLMLILFARANSITPWLTNYNCMWRDLALLNLSCQWPFNVEIQRSRGLSMLPLQCGKCWSLKLRRNSSYKIIYIDGSTQDLRMISVSSCSLRRALVSKKQLENLVGTDSQCLLCLYYPTVVNYC